MIRKLLILALFVSLSNCDSLDNVYETCGDNVKCAEEKIVTLVDEIDLRPTVKILGGFVTIERIGEETSTARKEEGVVDRILRYLSNHELKVKLPASLADARTLLSETRSSKLKKILIPALVLLMLKAAVLVPAVLSAITLVAFKGLGAGLAALALAAATSFKAVLEGHAAKRVSFEVVPPHSHWSRAGLAPSGPAYVSDWPQLAGYHTMPVAVPQ